MKQKFLLHETKVSSVETNALPGILFDMCAKKMAKSWQIVVGKGK